MIVSCRRHRLSRVQIYAEMLNYLSVYYSQQCISYLQIVDYGQFSFFYRVTKQSWFVCRCDLSVHVHVGPPPTSVDNQKAGHTQHTLGLLHHHHGHHHHHHHHQHHHHQWHLFNSALITSANLRESQLSEFPDVQTVVNFSS